MRNLRRDIALLALPALSNAVALSDMTPRATGLPPACNEVYNQEISGCTPGDWTSKHCSSQCIAGLQALVEPIKEACGGHGLAGENLIVAFLANVGPRQLCPNAVSQSATQTSTQKPTTTSKEEVTTTSTSPPEETSSTTTTESETSTSSEPTRTRTKHKTITSGTLTATRLATTSDIVSDTSSIPSSSNPTATEDNANSEPTNDASQPIYDDGSGGGSPFDTEGNMMDAASSLSFSAVLGSLSAMVALFAVLR